MDKRERAILAILAETYANQGTALKYQTPFEFLVAVILSAQCTDERVNIVAQRLFPRFSQPAIMAKLTWDELAGLIRDCGLYKNKAKNILATAKIIAEQYKGELPSTREGLQALPGVGRKTANVVLMQIFNQPAIAVDTHVFRVARRLGLSSADNEYGVEEDLMRLIPRDNWGKAHHWLIWHGRKICKARKPLCGECPLRKLCDHCS